MSAPRACLGQSQGPQVILAQADDYTSPGLEQQGLPGLSVARKHVL